MGSKAAPSVSIRRHVDLSNPQCFRQVFRAHAAFADNGATLSSLLEELGVDFDSVKRPLATLGQEVLEYTRYVYGDDSAEWQAAIDKTPLLLAIHDAVGAAALDPESLASHLLDLLERELLAKPGDLAESGAGQHPWGRYASETSAAYLDAHDVERDPRAPPSDARPGGAHRMWSEPEEIVKASACLVTLSPGKLAWLVAALNKANPHRAGARLGDIEAALRRNDDRLGPWPTNLEAYLRRTLVALVQKGTLWSRGRSTRVQYINPVIDEATSADVRILLALAASPRDQARRFDPFAPRCCRHDRIDRRVALDEFVVQARSGLTQSELVAQLGLGAATIADAEARLRNAGILQGSGRSARTLAGGLQPLVLQAMADTDGDLAAAAARLDTLIRERLPSFAAHVPLDEVGRMFIIRQFLPWHLAHWDEEASRIRISARGMALIGRCGSCAKPWGGSRLGWQVEPIFREMTTRCLPTHIRCAPKDSHAVTTPPVCHGCKGHLWLRPTFLGDVWREAQPKTVEAMVAAWNDADAAATAAGPAGHERRTLLNMVRRDLFSFDASSAPQLDLVERAARGYHQAIFQGRKQVPRGAPSVERWAGFVSRTAHELHDFQAPQGPATLLLAIVEGWAYHLDCAPSPLATA